MGKVMIIADMDGSCIATPRGLELAERLGHDVEVVAFTYAPLKSLKVTAAKEASIRKRLLLQREKAVQKNIDQYQKPGQDVSLKVVWQKNIDEWITRQCAVVSYSWVIKTGSHSGNLVHTSTDWQLLRHCPVPVFLVADKKWHRAKPVLVTLDLSTAVATKRVLNEEVLGQAKGLAEALGVELEIISAIEIPALLSDLDLIDPGAYVKDARETMKPRIKKLARLYDLPESAFHTKRGPVERVISSQAAKVRAQIVVMGTVARKGVRARLLGNTAEKVLRHMKTDVLAIKP